MMSTTTKRRRRSARTAAVAMAAIVAGLSVTGAAQAQQVVVQGNQRVDAETIRSYITETGTTEEIRQNLLATGMFSSVSVTRQGSRIVVRVSENQSINRVVFEGNSKVERTVLEQEVQTRARGPYSQAVVDADIQRILDVYRRTGRGLAQVTSRVVELPNGRIDVVFSIVEGAKTGVKEIRFVGNSAISSGRLRGVMTTTEMNFLSFMKTSDVYDPDRLAADQELIRRYYLKNGFADFRIISTDAQFDANAGGYIVTISLEEGAPYRIGNVNIESRIPEIDVGSLRGQLATSAGATYNADAVERTLQNITVEVARRGYPFALVRPVGARDPATQTVNLGYIIEEGPHVYIERIQVRGNTRTRDYVVRREFDVGEGDAYNKVLIDRAERRLNNLGYFKRVRITTEPGSAPDRVVVNVDVEDQSTGSFSVSGGYSTADGFIGEVAISESNFLGRGQYVRIAGQYGERTQGVDFSFTEPYFLGYRL
ncbi:MAG: outer membrane protein assembly factor BamA, partial [Microvirga sp.]